MTLNRASSRAHPISDSFKQHITTDVTTEQPMTEVDGCESSSEEQTAVKVSPKCAVELFLCLYSMQFSFLYFWFDFLHVVVRSGGVATLEMKANTVPESESGDFDSDIVM